MCRTVVTPVKHVNEWNMAVIKTKTTSADYRKFDIRANVELARAIRAQPKSQPTDYSRFDIGDNVNAARAIGAARARCRDNRILDEIESELESIVPLDPKEWFL